MPRQRTSINKLRESLGLRRYAGLSIRQIRDILRVSVGAIQNVAAAAEQQGITWPLICSLDDTGLAQRFYPQANPQPFSQTELPDSCAVHKELRKS